MKCEKGGNMAHSAAQDVEETVRANESSGILQISLVERHAQRTCGKDKN